MTIGLVADAISNADDSTATREGLFDLSSFPHALFFGGIALAILGLLTLVFGTWMYKPGRVTVGRRLLQVGAPIAAIVLVGGCAAIADGSQYAEPHAAGTDAAATGAEAASTDEHAMDHSEAEMNAAEGDAHSESHESEASSVPPKKYDPTLPIDLGGVAGVTPEQQARAENLIAITLARLPQFADYKVAEAAGFRSIGDAVTGDEHFINIAYFDDGAHPRPGSSRVARVRAAARWLEEARGRDVHAGPEPDPRRRTRRRRRADAVAHPQQPLLHLRGPRRRPHECGRQVPRAAEQGQRRLR